MQDRPTARRGERAIDAICVDFSAGSGEARTVAKEQLVEWAIEHMRATARRMLRGFPRVRRWDETDDVLQEAALRLCRALDATTPADSRQLLGLMALQVRRELIDLARRYGGPESFAKNHDTNAIAVSGRHLMWVGYAVDQQASPAEEGETWTRFHEAASQLDEEERELFNLVWYLGLKQEDAARVLECSVRTVARRWESTKKHLLAMLGGQAPA